MRTTPLLWIVRLAFMATACAIVPALLAATLSERLSEVGHPNTRLCQLQNSAQGLGDLPVLQFERRETSSDNDQEAVALMKLLAPSLISAGRHYAGFDPRKAWATCANQDPEYVFWRDYDDNWRFVNGTPSGYFALLMEDLAPEQRGTPVEAYMLYSLGLVEQRLGRVPLSVDRFEQAYAILETSDGTDDPKGIKASVLAPLVQHYFVEGKDEVKGEVYLQAYALVADSPAEEKGEVLPIVKVAPVYPRRAMRTGREGYVVLEFTVDADGRVRDPVVIEESPEGVFGEAAIDAASQFRYVPKVVDGKRVPVSGVRNRIAFELEG